jgi:hypothetical protein
MSGQNLKEEMKMLTVTWIKSQADTWLAFETFNLETCTTNPGVYVIWHAGNPGRVVYIGQGNVRDRLTAHRDNSEVTAYRASGTLYVTWASVPARSLDGVERYLADSWKPLAGDHHPNVQPIPVNSPFAA